MQEPKLVIETCKQFVLHAMAVKHPENPCPFDDNNILYVAPPQSVTVADEPRLVLQV